MTETVSTADPKSAGSRSRRETMWQAPALVGTTLRP